MALIMHRIESASYEDYYDKTPQFYKRYQMVTAVYHLLRHVRVYVRVYGCVGRV